MRSPEVEERFRTRRGLTVDRVLDLDPELRAELAVKALMILASDMPAIANLVLDQAEAMTPPAQLIVAAADLARVVRGTPGAIPAQR